MEIVNRSGVRESMVYPKSQSGSVASFIVIAILLVGVTVGAVLFVRHRGEIADANRHGEVISQQDSDTPAQQPESKDESSQKEREAQEKAQSEAKKKIQKEKKSDSGEQKPKSTQRQDKKDATPRDVTTNEPSEAADTPAQSTPMKRSANENTGGADLPETGPAADAFASVLGVVAIMSASYIYYHFGRK